jgi:hypothetical protein
MFDSPTVHRQSRPWYRRTRYKDPLRANLNLSEQNRSSQYFYKKKYIFFAPSNWFLGATVFCLLLLGSTIFVFQNPFILPKSDTNYDNAKTVLDLFYLFLEIFLTLE